MARLWERLQDPNLDSRGNHFSFPITSSTSCTHSVDTGPLSFIEVGKGKPADASDDILHFLNLKNRSQTNSEYLDKARNSRKWNWPSGLSEWTENEIASNMLDVISKKLPSSAVVGLMASDSIEHFSLAKMQIAATYRACQEGCTTLMISGDLPLPIGMPKHLGIRDYLAGKASLHDILHFSVDGKTALLTDGNHHDSGHFCLQENTYLGLLKSIRRRFNLVLSGFQQSIANSLTTTFLGESDGVFVVAHEGEDGIVERWQKALTHQGITYLGWITFKSTLISHAQSHPCQSPSDWRQAG